MAYKYTGLTNKSKQTDSIAITIGRRESSGGVQQSRGHCEVTKRETTYKYIFHLTNGTIILLYGCEIIKAPLTIHKA